MRCQNAPPAWQRTFPYSDGSLSDRVRRRIPQCSSVSEKNSDLLMPDSGFAAHRRLGCLQSTKLHNLSCAAIRPAGFVRRLCSRRIIRRPRGGRCAGIRLRMCTANRQGRSFERPSSAPSPAAHPSVGGLMKSWADKVLATLDR